MAETVELLGALAPDDAGRDAIHVAVVPVVAGHILTPGEHVGWMDETRTTVGRVASTLGVVDPFLRGPVMPHQRCFLFLYPKSITGLRHVWTHPEFAEEGAKSPTQTESEEWIRSFIARSDCPGYDKLLQLVSSPDGYLSLGDDGYRYLRLNEDSLHVGGSDASGEIPSELWGHLEVVTGRKIPREKRAKWFSCSC